VLGRVLNCERITESKPSHVLPLLVRSRFSAVSISTAWQNSVGLPGSIGYHGSSQMLFRGRSKRYSVRYFDFFESNRSQETLTLTIRLDVHRALLGCPTDNTPATCRRQHIIVVKSRRAFITGATNRPRRLIFDNGDIVL